MAESRSLWHLRRWRWLIITFAYGRYCRMNLGEIGREWGEGEWVARDLWSKP